MFLLAQAPTLTIAFKADTFSLPRISPGHLLNLSNIDMLGSLIALVACVHLPFISAKPGVVQEISLLEHNNSPLLLYPTQFTQNIIPKQIHSHNDCEYFGLSRLC